MKTASKNITKQYKPKNNRSNDNKTNFRQHPFREGRHCDRFGFIRITPATVRNLKLGRKTQDTRNFNPSRRTYNPHFHIIVANREMAETLVKEWTKRSKPGWTNLKAQKFEKVADNLLALIGVVKYEAKYSRNRM